MKLLPNIYSPKDLRGLSQEGLTDLAREIRAYMQSVPNQKEGHIKSSLGVVELTIALHFVFDTPNDLLIWDVGHQAYAHKIICERRETFLQNRQYGGLSGFTARDESAYDPFGAGHSSTALSAAAGFATSAQLKGLHRQHIAVVGDGAFTGGMHFEAMNYIGAQRLPVILIINDNNSSIDENVGALHKQKSYKDLCAALGFRYQEHEEGHDIPSLNRVLSQLNAEKGPIALRVKTEKGRGFTNPKTNSASPAKETFSTAIGAHLLQLAQARPDLVLVSPAMLSGGGFGPFRKAFPERCFDVGIAEQHAVGLSAAMAADGQRVYCHLYSTFAQRAMDQIVHDVALQKLNVCFLIDRAGLVGEDGPTHHGLYDLPMLESIPNCSVYQISTRASLEFWMEKVHQLEGAHFLRYPKGKLLREGDLHPSGSFSWIRQGGQNRLLLYSGELSLEAEELCGELGYDILAWHQIKPFPEQLFLELIQPYQTVALLEELPPNCGLSRALSQLWQAHKCKQQLQVKTLPEGFIPHGSDADLARHVGFDSQSLRKWLL